MSLRVLFVNDDEAVLSALRANLRRRRRQWDMTFLSGVQAAQAIAEQPFDVVVTELILGGVNGLDLLRDVARERPGTIRVVLSGSADPRGAMQAAQVAHQYLAMPCEPAELIRRIERSERLRSVLSSERIASLGSLDRLPSPPAIHQQLRDALTDPDTSVHDVASIVERDAGITAKILQLVNSAFFSRVRRIANVQAAVGVLGLDLLQGLVLQQALYGASFQRV